MFKRAFASFAAAFLLAEGAVAGAPEKSVIQITTFSQQPIWDAPWRSDSVRRSSGTGFVIKGRKIITNAHVVSWARQIILRKYQDPRPYPAKVKVAGHDCDLAVLEAEDEAFFDGLEPLELGGLPTVRSSVSTYGYPAGGEQISYTKGVVSRIEIQGYAHPGNRGFLAVQTDAAINPGNSGGPVIQDDKVVGVAFQGLPGLENAGFFIPTLILNHLLKDIEDGSYKGFPQAGVRMVSLQNDAYRRLLKLPDDNLGARIDHIYEFPKTRELLKIEDVILKVGNFDVGSDGSILYEGNRVFAAAAFSEKQHGESIPLTIWRDGGKVEVQLPLEIYTDDRAEGNQYDVPPKYFVHGGLVFVPLSRDYMRGAGFGGSDSSTSDLNYELFYRKHEFPKTTRPEPVVLASVLAHEVNANFSVRGRALVNKINGVRINRMSDLPEAFAKGGKQDLIEFFPDPNIECLDHEGALKANPAILKSYGLPNDRRL